MQIVSIEKNKKNVTNLPSADLAQRGKGYTSKIKL